MNKFLLTVISLTILFICNLSLAQDIYVYPNKRLADQGLIEYRRYTIEEARSYQQAGAFEPYMATAWVTERQLTQDQQPFWPQVVTSGDSIFCAYHTIAGLWPYYISSYNSGTDWSECLFMGDTSISHPGMYPSIVYYNGQLLVGFKLQYAPYGEDLFYRISSNAGVSWGPLRRVLGYWQYDFNSYSSATNSDSTIYWVYNEGIHDSLYVIKSTNFGNNWSGRGTPIAYLNSTPQCMIVRASANIVHVVWVNEVLPVSVRYSRSTNSGLTWSPEIDIAQDPYGSQSCYISTQGQHVVASWMGYKYSPYTFTGDMFIEQSYDGGATWDTAQMVTDLHYVWMGSNYIKDSLIVIIWQDDRYRSQNYNSEVYAKYSTDYGATWSQETKLSHGDDDSDSPIATSTEDIIHVLWGDRRPEAAGLYYINNNLHDNIENEVIQYGYSQITSYPNPFNSLTIIKYPANEGGEIGIYNLLGQQVKALRVSSSGGQVVWDGTDNQNMSVPSGVYFARIKASGISSGVKLVLLR